MGGPQPVGFPKPEIRGKGSFTPPKPKTLDRTCESGDYVSCDHDFGNVCGILHSWNGDVAIIQLDDGGTAEIGISS